VIPREIFYLVYFLCGGGLVFASIWIGFRMGRMSKGIVEQAKPSDPGGTNLVEQDPYEEAMRSPEEARRIPTVGKEDQ